MGPWPDRMALAEGCGNVSGKADAVHAYRLLSGSEAGLTKGISQTRREGAMRQLTYVDPGRAEWQEAPDPALPDTTGAVVRPLAVARCDLDLPMATAGLFPGPFAVGHETVAEVVTVGDDVRVRKPGERVLVPFQV